MTQRDDGGPAFPAEIGFGMNPVQYAGMSLRDWYAGQAMAGILNSRGSFGLQNEMDGTAKEAYRWADSLLAARSPAQEGGETREVRRADLERAMQAADGAHSRSPGTPDQLDRIWQDAFAAALGLEIAEGEADGR